jgi:hypothetical protein
MRVPGWIAVAAWALIITGAATPAAEPTAVKPTKQYSGSVDDEALQKLAPEEGVIADTKTFTKLWKAWKVAEKVPEVDFKKQLVLVQTTSGSRLNIIARLTEDGDLKVIGMATADFGPGFRYQIFIVSREGVKTVNGKQLPKDE